VGRILLNDPAHAGGSDEINNGTSVGDNTGDTAFLTGAKLKTNLADINTMSAELYGRIFNEIMIPPSGDTSGATDTANLAAYFALAAGSTRSSAGLSGAIGATSCLLGNGDYWLNNNVLNGTPAFKAAGIKLYGRGPNKTAVHYTPTTPGTPLITNKRWLNFEMQDISFIGNDATADFFQSLEQGGFTNIQDNLFANIQWIGAWQSLFLFCGGNNNSENAWRDCEASGNGGSVANWLYIPGPQTATMTSGNANLSMMNINGACPVGTTIEFATTIGTGSGQITAATTYFVVASVTGSPGTIQVSATAGGPAITPNASGTSVATWTSDQFLNYWWTGKSKFTSQGGAWINAGMGGSFSIRDADISANSPSVATYLFNLLGATHSNGVCSFNVDKLRIEHSTNSSLLLHSQWPQGNVVFRNLDQSSQAGNRPITQNYVLVDRVNTAGAIIRFEDSQLLGTHTYTCNSSDNLHQSKAIYDGCTLIDNPSVADFMLNSLIGNSGGFVDAHFKNCRNTLSESIVGYREVVDSDPNAWQTAGGTAERHGFQMLSSSSDWPSAGGNFHIRIPRLATIVQVTFIKRAGSGNSGAFQYTLQTNEATPTVLAGGASTPMAGANAGTSTLVQTGSPAYVVNPYFFANTDLARELVLVDSLSGGRSGIFTGVFCLVEYIG